MPLRNSEQVNFRSWRSVLKHRELVILIPSRSAPSSAPSHPAVHLVQHLEALLPLCNTAEGAARYDANQGRRGCCWDRGWEERFGRGAGSGEGEAGEERRREFGSHPRLVLSYSGGAERAAEVGVKGQRVFNRQSCSLAPAFSSAVWIQDGFLRGLEAAYALRSHRQHRLRESLPHPTRSYPSRLTTSPPEPALLEHRSSPRYALLSSVSPLSSHELRPRQRRTDTSPDQSSITSFSPASLEATPTTAATPSPPPSSSSASSATTSTPRRSRSSRRARSSPMPSSRLLRSARLPLGECWY